MGGRRAVGGASSEIVENILQVVASGDDNARADRPQVEEQPEIVQITVVEGVFVVPFDLQRHFVFETVDFMRGRRHRQVVHDHFGLELLFNPAAPVEKAVDMRGHLRFSPAWVRNP